MRNNRAPILKGQPVVPQVTVPIRSHGPQMGNVPIKNIYPVPALNLGLALEYSTVALSTDNVRKRANRAHSCPAVKSRTEMLRRGIHATSRR